MKFKYILLLTIVIYGLYMLPYVWTASKIPADTKFEIVSAKGDYGLAEDYLKFGIQMQSYVHNGHALMQADAYDANRGMVATGALGSYVAGLPYLFSDQAMIPWLIMPLFSIFLIVLMLSRLYIRYFSEQIRCKRVAWITVGTILLLCITGGKAMVEWGMFLIPPSAIRFLGYIGRFPGIQFTVVFLVFWICSLLEFFRNPNIKTAIALTISLVVVQYAYFYFFTGAFVFTAIFGVFYWRFVVKNWRLVLGVAGITALLVAPYWVYFIGFSTSAIGAEYTVRVGRTTENVFWFFSGREILLFCLFCAIDFFYLVKNHSVKIKSAWGRLPLFSALPIVLYLSVFVLMNIQFVMGYTVQNYHWIETFFYPLLVIPAAFALARLYQLLSVVWSRILSVGLLVASALIFVVYGVGNAYSASNYWKDYHYLTKSEQEMLRAVEEAPGEVLFSNSINAMVLCGVHTNKKPFVADAFMTTLSNDSIARYLVEGFRWLGYNETQIMAELAISEEDGASGARSAAFRAKYVDTPGKILGNTCILSYIAHNTYYDASGGSYHAAPIAPLIHRLCGDSLIHKPDLLLVRLQDTTAGFLSEKIKGTVVFQSAEFILFDTNR